MSREEAVLVLFDKEEEYSIKMSDFIKGHKGIPWKIRTYSDESSLMREEKGEKISLLVVSERSYSEKIKSLNCEKTVILNESGFCPEDTKECIDKYQAAESVLQILLQVYIEIAGEESVLVGSGGKTKFIGIYSPVKRSLQTTFAITMCELLSGKGKTLYLNFEHYTGVAEIIAREGEMDLADLVYFLNSDIDKFKLHFQTVIKQVSGTVFVPPMRYGQNLISISGKEWMNLLKKISESDMFDYVVMDLTDSLQGLPDILRACFRVFTVQREDSFAQLKMMQYETMLTDYDYGDVIEKTVRFVFPKFHYLPSSIELYSRGDLAEFVKTKLKESEVCDA